MCFWVCLPGAFPAPTESSSRFQTETDKAFFWCLRFFLSPKKIRFSCKDVNETHCCCSCCSSCCQYCQDAPSQGGQGTTHVYMCVCTPDQKSPACLEAFFHLGLLHSRCSAKILIDRLTDGWTVQQPLLSYICMNVHVQCVCSSGKRASLCGLGSPEE